MTGSATKITPITSPVELLVQLLKQAALVGRPMQDGVATPNAVTLNELKIIMCLGGEGALAGHEISDIFGMAPMNASRALSSLARRGWIEAVRDPRNKRRKPFQLSAEGWRAYSAMTPDVARVAEELFGGLAMSERQALGRIIEKILARIENSHVEAYDLARTRNR